jgi:hypothetical protein
MSLDPAKLDMNERLVISGPELPAWRDVALERQRQDAKWGQQNHPDGTGVNEFDKPVADAVRQQVERAAAKGRVTWRLIAAEEVAEAFAEDDPEALRVELIQASATFLAWAQAIDRRLGR